MYIFVVEYYQNQGTSSVLGLLNYINIRQYFLKQMYMYMFVVGY